MATEKRLIDANEALKRFNKSDSLIYFAEHYTHNDVVYDILRNTPTVDAVEVVHGRWELHGNDDDCGCSYFCSNCHESWDEDWFYVHGKYRHLNYCPNCGAKMDGDGNDHN